MLMQMVWCCAVLVHNDNGLLLTSAKIRNVDILGKYNKYLAVLSQGVSQLFYYRFFMVSSETIEIL